ncbi:MAG: PAS domain-containing protein [Acidobacteriota bacterium]|nr:PAS domain-containing protein [Acidobacteriota bacterium]
MRDASQEHETPLPTARILIVDADPGALETLSDSVTGLGYTVCHAAAPGPPALDLPAGTTPDLALIGLEAGDAAAAAIETAEQVAKRFGAPIVYATATADPALLERTERTEPHGYVLKSADPRQLGLTLRAALSLAARQEAERQRHERRVTDLKASVANAERDHTILRCLFEQISDAVIIGDTQGKLTALNPAARRLGGTPMSDANAWRDHYDTYQADGRTPFEPGEFPLARAIRGETTLDVPVLLRPSDKDAGTADIWLSASGYPLLDAHGKSYGGAILLKNVTALREQAAKVKQVETELHERVQVLNAIIRSMSEGVVVVDASERLTLANPSARRVFGVDVTQQLDEWAEFYGVFYPDAATLVPADELPLVRAARGETVENAELFIRNPQVPDGVYISVNASPVRDKSQNVVGGVGVFRDVSERKMEEEALAQAFAHGRLEVIDTLLHNIGNAINSVATGVDTLHEWFEDNELLSRFDTLAELVDEHERDWTSWLEHDEQGRKLRPYLLALIRDLASERKSLEKTAVRARDRVRHIVDIVRTQETFADGTVERKLTDLPATIQNAVKVVRESLEQRGVAIAVDCSRAPREMLVQENRFQQMLVNLLLNAMEATDERAARPENDPSWRPEIRVLAYRGQQPGTLTIDVIDNGIGIERSRFGSLFNAGYTTKKNGTGLGLHSAANFVIGSGGSIQPLSDGIGHGATLRVTLRLVEEAKAAQKDG